MLYAEKIKMKPGCYGSQAPEEIAEIYISGIGFRKKEAIHEHVKAYPNSIRVKIHPYPPLIPAISSRGERYVRSNPDKYRHDDLLDLPRV